MPKPTAGLGPRSCETCSAEFQPYRRNQVTCSTKCYNDRPVGLAERKERAAEVNREYCSVETNRERRNAARRVANNPSRRLAYFKRNLRAYYDISYEEYLEMIEAQQNRCAICGDPPDPNGKGSFSRLHVDHHHGTGKVRALLCGPCNKGLGDFRDDPDRLRKAIEYLTEHTTG